MSQQQQEQQQRMDRDREQQVLTIEQALSSLFAEFDSETVIESLKQCFDRQGIQAVHEDNQLYFVASQTGQRTLFGPCPTSPAFLPPSAPALPPTAAAASITPAIKLEPVESPAASAITLTASPSIFAAVKSPTIATPSLSTEAAATLSPTPAPLTPPPPAAAKADTPRKKRKTASSDIEMGKSSNIRKFLHEATTARAQQPQPQQLTEESAVSSSSAISSRIAEPDFTTMAATDIVNNYDRFEHMEVTARYNSYVYACKFFHFLENNPQGISSHGYLKEITNGNRKLFRRLQDLQYTGHKVNLIATYIGGIHKLNHPMILNPNYHLRRFTLLDLKRHLGLSE